MNLIVYARQAFRLSSKFQALACTHRSYSIANQPFQSLGLSSEIVNALQRAFPHVEVPTQCQREFIPPLLTGKNIFIKDETGTGKSFGLLLALLNKFYSVNNGKLIKSTCLYVVPHSDLALQLYRWGSQIASFIPCDSDLLQICAYGNRTWLQKEQKTIWNPSSKITIGTPGILCDILSQSKLTSYLESVDMVVLDEADRLLNLPKKFASKSDWIKFHRHPPQIITLLKLLATKRSAILKTGAATHTQLVLSSATMASRTLGYIYASSESLFKERMTHRINLFERENKPKIPSAIDHYAIVVFPDGTGVDLKEYEQLKGAGEQMTNDLGDCIASGHNVRYAAQPYVLEYVARVFREERVQSALLVLKAESPFKRTVEQLRLLGVPSRLFETVTANEGDKRLLVCSEAIVHGIDLPSLTHVFVVGVPRSERMYQHIAGRVGRQGRGGSVISFLKSRVCGEDGEGGIAVLEDESQDLRRILDKLEIAVTRL